MNEHIKLSTPDGLLSAWQNPRFGSQTFSAAIMTKSDNRNSPVAQSEALIPETSTPVRAIPIHGVCKALIESPQACEIIIILMQVSPWGAVPWHVLTISRFNLEPSLSLCVIGQ